MLRLTDIPEGSVVEVMDFSNERHHSHRHFYHQHNRHRSRRFQHWGWEEDKFRDYLERIGIRKGAKLRVTGNSGSGSLMIKIDESVIAIGWGMAIRVLVQFADERSVE